MLDCHSILKDKLASILPTYYEMFLDSSTTYPCISYYEDNNGSYKEGNKLLFSSVRYIVKVYAKSVADMQEYAQEVDAEMRTLGLKRVSSRELVVDDLLQKVLTYEGRGLEINNN